MAKLIDSVSQGVPNVLSEVTALGRTLKKHAADALGFRNLTNYIARSLLETGGFRPQLHPRL